MFVNIRWYFNFVFIFFSPAPEPNHINSSLNFESDFHLGSDFILSSGSISSPASTLMPTTNERKPQGHLSSVPFAELEAIALTANRIAEWGAVDHLGGLPALRSLRFSGNPVTSGLGASEVRGLLSVFSYGFWDSSFTCSRRRNTVEPGDVCPGMSSCAVGPRRQNEAVDS